MSADQADEADRRYFVTERGVKLHDVRYMPDTPVPKMIVFMVHGYGHYIDGVMERIGVENLTSRGAMVCGISHAGHGHSEGLRAYIPDYKQLVAEVGEYGMSIHQEFPDVPMFLVGQSMGGAFTLLATAPGQPLHKIVKGVVVQCPMCRIAPEMLPPDWVIALGDYIVWMFPTLPLAPVPSTNHLGFKDPKERERAAADPMVYHGRPRLMTAWQMRDAVLDVQSLLDKYDLPFLCQHGDADKVTSVQASRELHEKAISKDKDIIIYEGFWHALLAEPDGGAERVRDDMINWLMARA